MNFAYFVYFAVNTRTGFIKVGSTYDPPDRVRSLSYAEQCEVRLVATVRVKHPVTYFERAVHAFLKDKHRFKEWFELTQDDIDSATALLFELKKRPISKHRSEWPFAPWRRTKGLSTAYENINSDEFLVGLS